MEKQPIHVVWLKRDLRTRDHAPLLAAEQSGLPYLVVTLLEPSLLAHPDTSVRHVQFIYHSVGDMNRTLGKTPQRVELLYGEAAAVFAHLHTMFEVRGIHSYQESGVQLTWERDKQLAHWCKTNGIPWTEYQRDGIRRGIRNRAGWDKAWMEVVNAPVVVNTYRQPAPAYAHPFGLPAALEAELADYPAAYQPAGESQGWKYLRSFADKRGFDYHRHISKPTESRTSCGRVSPYLAWGNLSVRQVYQYLQQHPNRRLHERAFGGMMTRLHWRCHFIQKFEVECEYETVCVNRGFELLEHTDNPAWVAAWQTGRTGYPLVDACMRAVVATGWINFRMRAMLVSFLCHHLDQDWRRGVYHLAQQFLDYEPGIHYPQFQMQAGTTGVNTVRMYNPVKQSQEHDPDGAFIKKWVPELADVPTPFIHEPWRMTEMEKAMLGLSSLDYPAPLVDVTDAGRVARDKIWGHRKSAAVRAEKARIVKVHTRTPRER